MLAYRRLNLGRACSLWKFKRETHLAVELHRVGHIVLHGVGRNILRIACLGAALSVAKRLPEFLRNVRGKRTEQHCQWLQYCPLVTFTQFGKGYHKGGDGGVVAEVLYVLLLLGY